MVHEHSRHFQSQRSIEKSNQYGLDIPTAKDGLWNSSSSNGEKSISFHRTIRRFPYKALLGCELKFGLTSRNTPLTLTETLSTEDGEMGK